ncbi:Tac1 [Columba guinea]|nr:Tac1 [Columba guinea]
MRLPLAFTVLLLASAQALAEEMGATDDLSYWSDWSDGDQGKEELPLPLEHFLQRMARRPRPQQFFGLMGKRDAGYGQISHKKEKISPKDCAINARSEVCAGTVLMSPY